MKSILNPSFKYVDAANTNIAETFKQHKERIMTANVMKLCKDCKWFTSGAGCNNPANVKEIPDFVHGNAIKPEFHWQSAQYMRRAGECGPDAKLFEPDPEPVPVSILRAANEQDSI